MTPHRGPQTAPTALWDDCRDAALYVHVPFCTRKCPYCAFYSIPLDDTSLCRKYLEALDMEIAQATRCRCIRTVYVGGGTPTALDAASLELLMGTIRGALQESPEEWTCEANPESLDGDKAALLAAAGVDRISIGAQTFDPDGLRTLGRRHGAADTRRAVEACRRAGIENVSLDLMYGYPGSSLRRIEQDIRNLMALAPAHVSVYALSVEPGTPLDRMVQRREIELPGDESHALQYELLRRRLAEGGYRQYELSNFALPGYRCRHNWTYWSGGQYIGCGPGAHSFSGGKRWWNPPDLVRWCTSVLESGRPQIEFDEHLSSEKRARELLVVALRRSEGVNRGWFRTLTGFDYRQLCAPVVRQLCDLGLLTDQGDRLRLTEKAYFVSDAVFRELI
ncbi:MAG TPA: radical SAM family heme chaperone HemW [Kiritimatiellae bacterium]|nr:radical SAM family heme chaperone HemW [Kiritimatiellia bacterium]